MPKIFISYRREDSQHQADRLHAALKPHVRNPKRDIFIDVDNIPAGVDFAKHLDEQVGQTDTLLALIGPGWLNAGASLPGGRRLDDAQDFVRIEIASALKREIRVVPVLLDGVTMPREDQLPDDMKQLARRNAVEVRRLSFDADARRLIRGLRHNERSRSVAATDRATTGSARIGISTAGFMALVTTALVGGGWAWFANPGDWRSTGHSATEAAAGATISTAAPTAALQANKETVPSSAPAARPAAGSLEPANEALADPKPTETSAPLAERVARGKLAYEQSKFDEAIATLQSVTKDYDATNVRKTPAFVAEALYFLSLAQMQGGEKSAPALLTDAAKNAELASIAAATTPYWQNACLAEILQGSAGVILVGRTTWCENYYDRPEHGLLQGMVNLRRSQFAPSKDKRYYIGVSGDYFKAMLTAIESGRIADSVPKYKLPRSERPPSLRSLAVFGKDIAQQCETTGRIAASSLVETEVSKFFRFYGLLKC